MTKARRVSRFVCSVGAILALAGCSSSQESAGSPASDALSRALRELAAESELRPAVRLHRGMPRFVTLRVPFEPSLPADPIVQSMGFLERHHALYGLSDPLNQLYLKRLSGGGREPGASPVVVVYGQHLEGIPVYGARLSVRLSEGSIVATSGTYLPGLETPVDPLVGEAEAARAALLHRRRSNRQVSVIGAPFLMYFNRLLPTGLGELRSLRELSSHTRLAYRVVLKGRLEGGGETSWTYFVDARDGALLRVRRNVATHSPDRDFDIETAGHGIRERQDWFDAGGPLGDYSPLTPACRCLDRDNLCRSAYSRDCDCDGRDAHTVVHEIYDFFFTRFHRHSYDGGDGQIEVEVDTPGRDLGPNAAQYDTASEVISVRNELVTSGWICSTPPSFTCGTRTLQPANAFLLGHEFTHGVIEHTPADLEYENEPGALNESFSDIFGALVSGETCLLTASMPNHWLNRCPLWGGDADSDNDYGNLHSNSAIHNHVAGLLVLGGAPVPPSQARCFDEPGSSFTRTPVVTPRPVAVSSLGTVFDPNCAASTVNPAMAGPKAADLFFNMLTSCLQPCDDFTQARLCAIQIAEDLVRTRTTWSACDVCQIRNAYAAVGIGAFDIDCDGLDDNVSALDLDADGRPDGVDNCPSTPNAHQDDTDGDDAGDACDVDDDDDGLCDVRGPFPPGSTGSAGGCAVAGLQGRDNCPIDANPGQVDTDGDGAGDACDDDDDNDGFSDLDEQRQGSDPLSRSSTPERSSVPGACTDGIDNDRDGRVDVADDGCDGDHDGVLDELDNCPEVTNPVQINRDTDSRGDVCDNCPLHPNENQLDIDGDGDGDVCDGDLDGDGVDNADDNCERAPNPDQFDGNGNGVGLVCDPGEQILLYGSTDREFIEGFVRLQRLPIRVPIAPCLDDCPDYFTDDFMTDVDVVLPFEARLRVVDERGFLVTRRPQLRFPVDGDFRFQPPAEALGGTAKPYSGRKYFLEIVPSEEVDVGKRYPMSIRVRSGRLAGTGPGFD